MSDAGELYDRIGQGYAVQRREDTRIAAQLLDALGDWHTLVNVGAGTGNYEPPGRSVVAVEPSAEMIAQRIGRVAPVVRATAEALPFGDQAFDTALAMFTIHHWSDRAAGLRELGRVAATQVSLVYDPVVTDQLWLHEFFPEIRFPPTAVEAPTADDLAQVLDVIEVRPLTVPHDCIDGFTGAFYGRPEAYLDAAVQAGMSTLACLPDDVRAAGTARLRNALENGDWDRRLGDLRATPEYDIGYRLVISRSRP